MMRSPLSLLLAVFALLAGHALALNITIGGKVGNITASDFLNAQDVVRTNCNDQCTPGQTDIDNCNGDATCLCSNATTLAVFNCQECMFTQLIALNKLPDDPRAGQATALSAYAAACALANVTAVPKNQTTLTLPADWDGPFGQGLTPATTAITLIAAVILGVGAITVVNTM